jgi:hypothetical protein
MKNRLNRLAAVAAFSLLPLAAWASPAAAADAPTAAAARLGQELSQAGVARFTASDYKPGVVRHIVLFRYKDTVTPAQRSEITRRFIAMQQACLRHGKPYIVSIEEGLQHSGEGADQDLQQGFVVTFRSQGDRNYYVGQPVITDPAHYEPVHQAFKEFVGPLLAPHGALVFDYTVGQSAR